MNVWILNHYAVAPDGSGGTRHAVLARHLVDAGHEVTVFASATPHAHTGGADLPAGRLWTDRFCDGVRFRFVRTSPYRGSVRRLLNMLSYRAGVLRACADLRRPDVVIGSCVHLHAADAGRRLARRHGIPFVFEVRDVWPESLVDVGAMTHRHPVYWYLRSLERRLYRDAEAVITLLPGMLPYLESNGVPRSRVWYVPNGIDPGLYPDAPPPAEAEPFVVSFFGAHGPANGLETALDAAALLARDPAGRGVRLRLVGGGADKPALEARARALSLQNVDFLPPVPKAELAPLAAESHAFLFHLRDMPVLRRYGVSANKLFDYLLAARPVVFACRSHNNPVEEAGAGVTVPPQDPPALARAVLSLRSLSQEDRDVLGRRGRAWVLAHHDLGRLAQELGGRLESLVAAGPGP